MRREELLNDPEESLRAALDGQQSRLWTGLPGVVTAVDLNAQTVSVQPTVQASQTAQDGTTRAVTLPLLINVPIIWPRGGGFAITLPIAAGDECFVHFASRCIDSWWQSGGVQPQAEKRMHDLSDGFATFGPTSQPRKLAGVSGENIQIRNEDGDVFVEITPGGIVRVVATSAVEIEAPSVTITADAVDVDSASITLGGIVWADHVHGGVQTGSSTTLVPE